jgi:cardiolipin synthase
VSRASVKKIKKRSSRALRQLRLAVRRAVNALREPTATKWQHVQKPLKRLRLGRTVAHPGDLAEHWERLAAILFRFGGASAGNAIKLYFDGDEKFEDLWQAIALAKRRVWLEVYILEPDRVGARTIEELTRAAERGCEVRLLFDAIGSSHVTESFLRPLRVAGGTAHGFNPLLKWQRLLRLERTARKGGAESLFRRDHRKIVVIDNKIGFCGGMNISEDYAGQRYGKSTFRDCHAQVQGPCVRDLAAVFASSWRMATHEKLRLPPRPQLVGETVVQVLGSRGGLGRRPIQRSLRIVIRRAVQHCYISTPYFVPPLRLRRALQRAAERGVDVRILTAGVCDVSIVVLAARHIYGRLLKHGVRIFEMYSSTLHAKTITIDGLYSSVGSFNLDTWSDKRNLEVNISALDSKLARQMEDNFMNDLQHATEVTMDTWQKRSRFKRLVHWAAYQLLRV